MAKESTFRVVHHQHPILMPLGVVLTVAGITAGYLWEGSYLMLGAGGIGIILGIVFVFLGNAEMLKIRQGVIEYRSQKLVKTQIPIANIVAVTPSQIEDCLNITYLEAGGRQTLRIPNHFGNNIFLRLRQLAKPEPPADRSSQFVPIGPYVYSPKPARLWVGGACVALFLVAAYNQSPWSIVLFLPGIQFFYLFFLKVELNNQMLVYRTWHATYKVRQFNIRGSYRAMKGKTWHILLNNGEVLQIPGDVFPPDCYQNLASLEDRQFIDTSRFNEAQYYRR